MDYKTIIYEQVGNVATITLNRPWNLNAMTLEMVEEIIDALCRVAEDDDVRALVFTGAGRGFCSGDDIKQRSGLPAGGSVTESFRLKNHMMYKTIRSLRKPVIAAVNGNAHGAGSDLMLSCDFRIASEDAIFGDIRTGRAITVLTGGTYLWPKVVGLSKAIELLFTGDLIDAREAERIGLVNKTVPADNFMAEVMELASKLAKGPTKLIGRVKEQIYRELNMDLAAALEDEMRDHREVSGNTADTLEGRQAFFDKRTPNYDGL